MNFPKKKDSSRPPVMLIDAETLLWEAGIENVDENPPDRKAQPAETQAAAEVAVFLEDDLGVDTRRLYIQVRDGFLYVQGSVETPELRKEILELLPQRSHYKGCQIHLTVQKSE